MKFLVAVLFTLALAMGVQSSVVSWPWGWGNGAIAVQAPAAVAWPSPLAPGAISLTQGPAVWGAHGAAVVAAHAPVVVAAPAVQGSYVAQTRGAVHTAPLAGHTQSVANVNVAPAPGTL